VTRVKRKTVADSTCYIALQHRAVHNLSLEQCADSFALDARAAAEARVRCIKQRAWVGGLELRRCFLAVDVLLTRDGSWCRVKEPIAV